MFEAKSGSIPLFDVDLTLIRGSSGVDTDDDHYTNAIRQVYRIDGSSREITSSGMTAAQIFAEVLRLHKVPEGRILTGMRNAVKVFEESFSQNPPTDIVAMPGAHELLTALHKRNYPLGLLTGSIEGIAWRKLQMVNLDHFFQFGAYGDNALQRSDLIEVARKNAGNKLKLNISSERLVIIGDSPLDILAAKKGGIRSIGIGAGLYTVDQLRSAGADLAVSSLNDRQAILDFLK